MTPAQQKAAHKARMAARRERQDIREQKAAVKREYHKAADPQMRKMWRTVWNRLVLRQHGAAH